MVKKIIQTDQAPEAIGSYSQGIVVEPNRLLFTAGQIALDPETGSLVEGDIEVQTKQVLENIRGILAAAGLVALHQMSSRMNEDKQKAEILADSMKRTGLFEIKPEPVQINMFFARFVEGDFTGMENRFVRVLEENGVLTYPAEGGWLRFVTHYHVGMEEIRDVASRMEGMIAQLGENAAER